MWNTSMMQFTSVMGPALGGLVVAWNVPSAYIFTAASSLIYLAMVARLKLPPETKPVAAASFKTLVAGMQFVWNRRIIFTMISLDMFAVLLGGAVYLLPIFAEDILNVGASGFGWLRAAPAVGAFILGVVMVYLPPMKRAGRMLLVCIAAFGVATIVFGLSKSFWLSFAMLALTGAFDNVSMVIRQTLQQMLTPNEMRGRVSAVSSIFVGASNELGGFESGVVAQGFGPVFSVVSGGIGTILVVIAAGFLSPELRRYGALVTPATPALVPPATLATVAPAIATATISSTSTSAGAPFSASDD
jgi:MFS family permease